MKKAITEKDYPIESKWILKSILSRSFGFIMLAMLILVNLESASLGLIYFLMFTFPVVIIYLQRNAFHYSIEDSVLSVKQGILNKQEKHMQYGVIQNIFVKQDIFDRLLGLSSLTLENAAMAGGSGKHAQKIFGVSISNKKNTTETVGFVGNEISIPGLKKANAEILKGILLDRMKMNPIDDRQSGL